MAHKNEEPVGWVTVKGKHFPKWADGTIGWQDGEESDDRDDEEKAMDLVDSKDYIGDKALKQKVVENLKGSGYDLGKGITVHSAEVVRWDGKSDEGIVEATYTLRGGSYGRGQEFTEELRVPVRKSQTTSKKATMELGNGLRLTADVSNPNKNISEVERARKVNKERWTADKKLNQYRQAAAKEKEKAQSIADAISAKTGIANTGSRNAKYDTSRANNKKASFTIDEIGGGKRTINDAKILETSKSGMSGETLYKIEYIKGTGKRAEKVQEWVSDKQRKKKK